MLLLPPVSSHCIFGILLQYGNATTSYTRPKSVPYKSGWFPMSRLEPALLTAGKYPNIPEDEDSTALVTNGTAVGYTSCSIIVINVVVARNLPVPVRELETEDKQAFDNISLPSSWNRPWQVVKNHCDKRFRRCNYQSQTWCRSKRWQCKQCSVKFSDHWHQRFPVECSIYSRHFEWPGAKGSVFHLPYTYIHEASRFP